MDKILSRSPTELLRILREWSTKSKENNGFWATKSGVQYVERCAQNWQAETLIVDVYNVVRTNRRPTTNLIYYSREQTLIQCFTWFEIISHIKFSSLNLISIQNGNCKITPPQISILSDKYI